MYEVKVKTLDGLTQEYSVPDDASVLQFKEIIKEKTNIPVERQRLLYQGRLLLDESLLNSYEVAGNVMHLVTRLPPQLRPTEEAVPDIDNSDNSNDQFRNILSDVFGSLGDINNPMGLSVSNEGSRMDITVNIPSQNRLSLSRLRQNYVLRLLNQARNVMNHMEDPTSTEPRLDRERLRQADPYDIGPNDEMLTDVTSQPLPINNLADMIGMARALWTSVDPQLAVWESVLRRENEPDSPPRSDLEMQQLHDSASRYMHLFSHVLHILSDYLVEFQASPVTRATAARNSAQAARTNAQTTSNATAVQSEGDTVGSESNSTSETDSADVGDRSRYLYVFSEMPAQVVQVRLDVDSSMHDLRSAATTPRTSGTRLSRASQSTRSTTSTTQTVPNMPPPVINTPSMTNTLPTASTTPASRPSSVARPTPVSSTPNTPTSANINRSRSRGRMYNPISADNLLRTALQDSLLGSASRPHMNSGARSLRTGPQYMDSIDPYLRCQSRHFQHPASLRSGAVIQTFSGIRLRETPSFGPRNPATSVNVPATSTANNATSGETNVSTQSTDSDHIQSLLGELMFLSGVPAEIIRPTTTDVEPTNVAPIAVPVRTRPHIHRLFNSIDTGDRSSLNGPLSVIYPDLLRNRGTDGYIPDQIFQLVLSKLSFMDILSMSRGNFNVLNKLREPLQEIITNYESQVGSRDSFIEHIVGDINYLIRDSYKVFEELRRGTPFAELSEEARKSFDTRLDIMQSINKLNRHHMKILLDMIMLSTTNRDFGLHLMNAIKTHLTDILILAEIIASGNIELREFLKKTLLNCIYSTIYPDRNGDFNSENDMIALDMIFSDVNRDLYAIHGRLLHLRSHTREKFVVYRAQDGPVIPSAYDLEQKNLMRLYTEQLSTPPRSDIPGWPGVTSDNWLQMMSHAATSDTMLVTDGDSDPYEMGMPAKRRKLLVSQPSVGSVEEMLQECVDEAIVSTGLDTDSGAMPLSANLTGAFQNLVTDRVSERLDTSDFVPDLWPQAHQRFSDKTKLHDNDIDEKDKKNK